MPWHIESDHPDCPGHAVVKDSDGEVAGCHDTKADAEKQMAALYANEEAAMPEGPDEVVRSHPPTDNLMRASYPAVELRSVDGAMPTMVGHFARFNEWTKIDSTFEGTFLERIAPGAFARTLKNNRDRIRVLFQHGRDPQIGDKPLGPIAEVGEDADGAYYEVPLLDTTYNRDLLPGLREGLYGSSFRFTVVQEDFEPKPKRSTHNPDGLPERTVREARLFEFGPVTFPAYAGATAGVRSITTSDLDAALAPPEPPALPGAGPAALPHSDEGTRAALPPPTVAEQPEAPPAGGTSDPRSETVEYVTPEEKAARVRELRDEATKIANDNPGVLPTEVQERWDAITAEQEALERDLAAHEARLRWISEHATDETKTVPVGPAPAPIATISRKTEADIYDMAAIDRSARSVEHRGQLYRDNAMRAAEQLRTPSDRYDQDKSRERLLNLLEYKDSDDKELARLVLATNSPQYRAAFNRYIRSGGSERGTALAVGVDGTGGYAVPVSFDPSVVAIGAWTSINPFRAACRVETIVGTDTWQALTATAITAAYALEAAAATEQGPTFARPEFIAKRAHAFVTASYEMAQDRPDLAAELGTLFGEAKDTLEENQFAIGAGTTVYPQGMGLKDAYTRVDSIGDNTHAVGDVLALEAGVPIRHRLNAAWFLCRAAIRAIQAYETTGGQLFNGVGYPAVGNPVNRPTGNTGLTLLGYPVWETPSMPWTPTVDDTTWGCLVDPRSYVIVDRVGMSVKVIPDMLNGATPSFPTGEIGIYAFWRGTARVLNADGGRQGAIQ